MFCIFWPTGVGKTSLVFQVLKTLARLNLCDYFTKGGGLKNFWDGYDNQPIAWIDNPVSPNEGKHSESIQQSKNVMSVGDCLVEVKYGTMVFDSNLLIVNSKIDPIKLAVACGEDNCDPIYHILTDTCGAFYLAKVHDKHYKALIGFISESCGLDLNPDEIIKALPPWERRDFSHAQALTLW